MARILATSLVALLLVTGGFWLAGRQPATAQASPGEEAEEAGPQLPDGVTLPEGFSLTPFLSEEQRQSFNEPEQVLEPGTDYAAILDTNEGTMVIDLFEDKTPTTVNSFVFLARHHYFDGIVFHRVLEDFMAQTGDPSGTGRGGPGYQFGLEIVPELKFDSKGVLGMARTQDPNSNGSQFFITFGPVPHLTGEYTVFGQVTEGLEVLDKLQRINPQQPSALAAPSDPLSALTEQGIELNGEPDTSVESYLTETLGAMPGQGQTFMVDGYTGVVGSLGGEIAIGFYPKPDLIEHLYIIQKPKS